MQDGPREKLFFEDSTLAKLRPILDVVRQINAGPDLHKILLRILDTLIDCCKARRGAIVAFKGENFKVRLARDHAGNTLTRKEDRGISKTVLQAVRLTGRRVVTTDARNDPAYRLVDSVLTMRLRSILCLPLRLKDKVVAAVYLENSEIGAAFAAREVEIAEILIGHAALAIENTRLFRKASTDRLTKLWNHAHFLKRLDSHLRHGSRCGVLMIDVDDFKKINDTYGHEAGNVVLKHIADTLSLTVRAADLVARADGKATVARFGGDEFEIILPAANRDGLRLVADRLVAALGGKKLRIGDKSLTLSISVGGAVYPDDAPDAEQLLARADDALYQSKRAGKNRAALYGVGL